MFLKLTGGQIFAKELKALGVCYVAGIPGYGSWTLVDALLAPATGIPFIQVMQEQSAVPMADGYFRACGRPMAALLPTPLRRSKALGAIETALAGGSAVLVVSGGEPELATPVWFEATPAVQAAVASSGKVGKARLTVAAIDKLSATLRKGFETMASGVAGPVAIEIPESVQAQSIEAKAPRVSHRPAPAAPLRLEPALRQHLSTLIADAERPVILVGSGVIHAEASPELLAFAEAFLAPVVTTSQAKGAFAEDHLLSGGTLGRHPHDLANALLNAADLVIALGCAADRDVLPVVHGARLKSAADPLLIIMDSDPSPVATTHPRDIRVSGGLKEALGDMGQLLTAPERQELKRQRAAYRKSVVALRKAWEARLGANARSDAFPLSVQQPLAELRAIVERDAILVVGAGSVQAAVREVFPVYLPRTHLCAGSFGEVGWAVPAAIGAKLAMPARQVVCVVGDGDFLQSMQEMAVCMMHTIPVVFLVMNNSGYASLSERPVDANENYLGGEFNLPDGKPYSPDFSVIARSFGLEAWRVEYGSQLKTVLSKALNSKGPSLVEVITARGNSHDPEA